MLLNKIICEAIFRAAQNLLISSSEINLFVMGAHISSYKVIHALGYGTKDSELKKDIHQILGQYKLLALVLHDPESHFDFHTHFENSFVRLDFDTGNDFLFFGLVKPPNQWIQKNSNREYYRISELGEPFNRGMIHKSQNESITAFTLASALNIPYGDLPVIIITDSFTLKNYYVVKTSKDYFKQQLSEIGFFCTQNSEKKNLLGSNEFKGLIKQIDFCNGNYLISNLESLARILSDYIAFMLMSSSLHEDREIANVQLDKVINEFTRKISSLKVEIEHTKLNPSLSSDSIINDKIQLLENAYLFFLGGISNLFPNSIDVFSLDSRCEAESQILLNTYLKVLPAFNNAIEWEALESNLPKSLIENVLLDFSPLIISLSKIFEIEINHSVVQWIRNQLGIEMPEYYGRYKEGGKVEIVFYSEKGRPNFSVNFNNRKSGKWLPPSIGQSKLGFMELSNKSIIPEEITESRLLLRNWETITTIRNAAAHSGSLNERVFNEMYDAFHTLTANNVFNQLNDLKERLKQ